jgi:signal transduction histidine kinase
MLRDGTSHYSSVHGAKRWQQGYCLEELIREVCLLRKDFVGRWFDAFEMEQTALSREARRCARGIVHRFFDDVIIGSTLQFVEEQQQRARDAEAALIAAKERAEVANEAKSRFIALISHELRTPLTPMLLGAAALELDKSLSPEVMDFVHLVNHSTLIEAALIGDLLDATRLTHEELTLQLAEVDVHACIQSAVDACAFDFQVKHIELKVSLCAESSWAAGDGKRMARAFTAILRNAAHVSRLGGCVTIQTRNVDRSIEISVQDCGVEFDERIAERIFLPFEEGRQSACGMGGMGVSRYVCKATIEAHGGTITAQSAGPNGGAVFLVTLPVLERSECV